MNNKIIEDLKEIRRVDIESYVETRYEEPFAAYFQYASGTGSYVRYDEIEKLIKKYEDKKFHKKIYE